MSPLRISLRSTAAFALSLAVCLGAVLASAPEAEARDETDVSSENVGADRADARDNRNYRSFGRRDARDGRSGRRTAVSGVVREDSRSGEASRNQRRFDARSEIDDYRERYSRRGWRDLNGVENIYARHGSYVYALDREEFDAGDGGNGYPLFVDIDPAVYGAFRSAWGPPSYPSDTKFIDIESERLDRRPVGPDGIEVTYTGGAKIIRIAPDYRMSTARQDAMASDTSSVSPADLQPWSAGWLRHCTQAYHDFDPTLGTYVALDGRIRFCER